MRWEESRSSETNGTSIQGRDFQSETLLENRKIENTNSFYKASIAFIPKPCNQERKFVGHFSHEHRYTNR